MFYKNITLKKADNGGYIVCYDKYSKSNDAYDGMRYMSEGREVFEKGPDALKRLDDLHGDSMEDAEEMDEAGTSGQSVDVKVRSK